MQIEDITPTTIKQENDPQLKSLRLRFIQIWENVYAKGGTILSGTTEIASQDFLSRYRILRREMAERGLNVLTVSDIDRDLLKAALGLRPAEFDDLVVIENYVSLGGSYARDPKSANDVDVIVRAPDRARDEGMELKLDRLFHRETGKDCHFVYAPTGPHSTYLPVFDLVLRPKQRAEVIRVDEREIEKFSRAYYEGLEVGDPELDAGNRAAENALAGGSVVDIGCGSGKFIAGLAKEGREVLGIDSDPTAIAMAEEKGISVLRADAQERLPIGDKMWDNVVLIHSLEHFKDPKAILLEAERIARRRVIVIAPLGERADVSHRQAWPTLDEFGRTLDERWTAEPIAGTKSAIAVLDKAVVAKAGLRPFGAFTPPKPAMKGLTEAFSVDQVLPWALKRFPLDAEEKLNGFRMIAEKAGSRVRIKTEGNQDRSKQLPDLIDKLSKIDGDFILDGNVGIDRHGRPLPRISLMTLMADRPELRDGDAVKLTLFDAPYIGEDLHASPLTDRRHRLEAFYKEHLKGDPHFGLTTFNIVENKGALQAAFKRLGWLPGSEGLVIKALDSTWSMDGIEGGWAKIKHDAEIKVLVLEAHAAKGGVWNYTCGLLPGDSPFANVVEFRSEKYVDLGKTFNSQIKASPGDILTCGVEEIIPSEDKLDWLGARVLDIDRTRTKPYFAIQAVQIADEANVLQVEKAEEGKLVDTGNIDFDSGENGTGVAQLHIMGIQENQATALRAQGARVTIARSDLRKLESTLKSIIGQHAAHIDLRFRPGAADFFEGGEIMIGNLDGLSKIYAMKPGQKLRFGWKTSHADEPRIRTIRGPLGWMEIGTRSVNIMAPGEPGALANTSSAIIQIDRFKWTIYLADRHAKKFHIESPGFMAGNWLMVFVPVAEGRVWMTSRLKDDDYAPVEKKLSEAERAECNAETLRIREAKKKPEAAEPHRFRAAKFTHPNGHPRCLVCGDEESIGKVCNMPDEWYQKHEWDDETAWAEERRVLKEKKIIKNAGLGEAIFRFIKVDKKQQIVGGVVYEPNVEDTQGDWADAAEIQQAMYRFMLRYSEDTRRIKVLHKGQVRHFPIVECFQPETDIKRGSETIKAGSWWMMVKVTDPDVWAEVESGQLTGFSMGGQASGKTGPSPSP